MDKKHLITILTNIDHGHWHKHDVRMYVDRMLNHGASPEDAEKYTERCIKVQMKIVAENHAARLKA